MINYTVIIPHYNIPELLRRCLKSIPGREDVQVVVVDDCSSDENQIILKEMENGFSNVQFVYLEKNQGGGHARNVGLQYAIGTYVLFADADDFFHECINVVFDEYKDETCDVVYFSADSVDSETYQVRHRADFLQKYLERYMRDNGELELKLRFLFPQPWCKMMKKSLIDRFQIRFDKTPAINDTTFSYMVGYHATTIKADSRKIYCVTYRPGSITYTNTYDRKALMVDTYGRKNRFLKDKHIPVFDHNILLPFKESYHERNWQQMYNLLKITSKYGFSRSFILFKLMKGSIQFRMKSMSKSLCSVQNNR